MTSLPEMATSGQRSALAITAAVYRALFLREALSRLFSRRAAWAWLLLEPMFHIGFMVAVFTMIRVRTVGGIDTMLWLVLGFLSFFLFRRTATQGTNAIGANRSLFAYRQVKPVDAVLARCALEALLMLMLAGVILVALALSGVTAMPHDPIAVMEAALGLWLLGTGFGLVVSVVTELVDELANVIDMLMTPLYLLSGVVLPLMVVPLPYRSWLMYNPVTHGLEALRLGFAPLYHAVPELSLLYLYGWALGLIFLGLALHVRFQQRLVAQ